MTHYILKCVSPPLPFVHDKKHDSDGWYGCVFLSRSYCRRRLLQSKFNRWEKTALNLKNTKESREKDLVNKKNEESRNRERERKDWEINIYIYIYRGERERLKYSNSQQTGHLRADSDRPGLGVRELGSGAFIIGRINSFRTAASFECIVVGSVFDRIIIGASSIKHASIRKCAHIYPSAFGYVFTSQQA